MPVDDKFLNPDEALKVLSGIETVTIHLPPPDIVEVNIEIMKKTGRPKESEAFQWILDKGLSNSYAYMSDNWGSYLTAERFKQYAIEKRLSK